MNKSLRIALIMAATVSSSAPSIASAQAPDWVEKSNVNAQILLEVMARFAPESAGRLGVAGLDEEVFDFEAGFIERRADATREARERLESLLAEETDPRVRQDLEILIESADLNIDEAELSLRLELPYIDVGQTIFSGIQSLLDDQIESERRPAALARLRKYTGLEQGYTPITELAEARFRERMRDPDLVGPFSDEIEIHLENIDTYVEGIGALFERYEIAGYEEAVEALGNQLAAYRAFAESEIVPRARKDFRLPEELYAHALRRFGIDISVDELVSRAKVSFREIQNEMEALAPLVAAQRGFDETDYRAVITRLKQEQLVGEAILPFFESRIKQLEEIIEREQIVTLPERDMVIRLASEAESAAIPAPHMRPPRLIGNTGERGEFVLPLRIPGDGGEALEFDDFTFDAAGWTITVHEGRPGHELQFASLVESGVSIARAIFAFNSVNVEGWALYSEAEMRPYLPLDGQLITLQHRLARAARAFLDPGLQLGMISREEALRLLREDVVVSEAMAQQEIERYTFRFPGQATSYFYGYTRLMELRTDVERRLNDRFDRRRFHDFVLDQGLIPPDLLREAVLEQFVPFQLGDQGGPPSGVDR